MTPKAERNQTHSPRQLQAFPSRSYEQRHEEKACKRKEPDISTDIDTDPSDEIYLSPVSFCHHRYRHRVLL